MGLILFTVIGYTQTIHVNSSTGSDTSGDGSFRKPFKTFTKGYDMVSSEGTLVLNGTFTWTDVAETGVAETSGFTISKDITIEGFGGGLAIVQAATSFGSNASRVFTIPQRTTVTFKNLEIRYGYLKGSNDGGGITIGCYSNVTVLNCYIHHNSARQGFAIESLNSNLIITNSTISDNSFNNGTVSAGGAIDAQEGGGTNYGITISNSTVCNNTGASYGGGISIAYGMHYVTNCTVVNNTCSLEGGGISAAGGDSYKGNVYIKNSIVANNISTSTVVEDYDDSYDGMTYDNGYNIIEYHNSPGLTGKGTVTGNQSNLFGRGVHATPSLTNNTNSLGIPTLAITIGSVAINAGNSSANGTVSTLRSDQRGLDRVGTYDIGAYEFGAVSKTIPTVATTAISTSDATSAVLGGIVVTEGGVTVSERGFIYSKTSINANPKIHGTGVTQVSNGSETGSYSSTISNLTPNTNYSVQSYASNSLGTSYGGVVNFTTQMGELIWKGTVSNNWATADNWNPAAIPTANYNVTIPAGLTNYPTLSTSGECNNLLIESTLTGMGSLIGQSNLIVNGSVTVQRYLTGVDKWHLISSPVEESITSFISANTAIISTNPGDDNLYGLVVYDNTNSNWNMYTTDRTSDNFITGKGYEVLSTSDGIVDFTGTLATGDVRISITSPNPPGKPWNLVGNPYPSAINANSGTNFLTVNAGAIHDSYKAIYVWDEAGSAYIPVNSSSQTTYIAPGQAFFVYSVDGGSTINFTEAMQTHQTGDNFKSGEISSPSIKLIAERSQGTSTTNIMYLENMTTGLDPGYDAGRFTVGDNSFAIYTHLAGDESNKVDFEIQCLPINEVNNIIPIGLNAPANTVVVLRAETINLPTNSPVILEDRLTGIFTNLTEPGSFHSVTVTKKTEGTGRFFLHTQQSITSVNNPGQALDTITIIPLPNYNSLRVIGNTEEIADLVIYDMLGRKLIQHSLNQDGVSEVEMGGLKSGAYAVCIRSSTQKVSKKISWIKN